MTRPSISGASTDMYLGVPIATLLRNASSCESSRTSFFNQLASIESLADAWSTVLVKDARDGQLQKQTQAIAGRLDAFLEELSVSLRDGTYRPDPMTCLSIPKRTPGEHRILNIPTIRDRVVERAVVGAIGQQADLIQSACSFAYRIGIGVDDAVDHLAVLRDAGYRYVLKADIDNYFPNINLADALVVLSEAIDCPDTVALIRMIASPRRAYNQRRTRSRGLAQGSSLSPLLANLTLTGVDRAMGDAGFGYARFADDLVVCAPREDDILEAYDILVDLLAEHGLTLDEEKTMMTTFDDGFAYLGVDFSGSLPQVDPHHDIKGRHDPDRVVYVGKQGARVHVSKERLIVDGPEGIPQMSIPRRAVSRVVLTGNVGLSAGARSWALYNDIDVICLSRRGSYLGQLAGPRSTASARRLLTQAAFAEDDNARLPLARAIIRAKLRNQVHVLDRTGRRDRDVDIKSSCQRLRSLADEALSAMDIDELMGLEGVASNMYFGCMSALVPEEVRFPARSRRPPRDLANAALSYAYAILLGECTGALFAAGLEPSLGVLHASTDKRPSLALDLMEEFRPLLVDRTVLALLRARRLRPEHAVASEDGEGTWLGREGKKVLVDGYEATLQRHVKGALPGFAGTWRRHIHHEAQLFGRAIMEPDYEWTGVSWR